MDAMALLMQIDGNTHRWFGDATSGIYAEFFDAETTLGCLKVLHGYIERTGLIKALYVDNAGIFDGPRCCNFSQVKRACEELGIEIIFNNTAQGKDRIDIDSPYNLSIDRNCFHCITQSA